jgi:heme/copper-type cytochrome/quinol oxidase subunit 2
LATAEDVTHSWALPSLGLKLDCVPGRLYVSFLHLNREGVYYGQCSELCGWNHYNMPIVLYALAYEHFLMWWELELHAQFAHAVAGQRGNYTLLNLKYK